MAKNMENQATSKKYGVVIKSEAAVSLILVKPCVSESQVIWLSIQGSADKSV